MRSTPCVAEISDDWKVCWLAVAAMGRLPKEGYSNSRLFDGVVLGPLTDLDGDDA